ncbi:MAG: GGDEF domain-containing protein [Lachnospiraceae bacterium]|nr:GGDEF domain-containing protein [Lachnospiraceae bacterium]
MEKDKKVLKKIALIICASNNERHRNIVTAVHSELKKTGGCVLYVLTNYGVFTDQDDTDYLHGEPANYSLLDRMELDGCLIESNIGSNKLVCMLAEKLKRRGVPTVTINIDVPGIPAVHLDARDAVYELMEHLVEKHGCRRINLVLNEGNKSISDMAETTYNEVLGTYGIPLNEKRILSSLVGIQIGRQIYDIYDRRGVMKDCDAVICVHDVCAIGLIMEIESRGMKVPRDVRICSLNHSSNSMAFRPDITGIDRMDSAAARKACDLLIKLINGESVPAVTFYKSRPIYRRSCGCEYQLSYEDDTAGVYQNIIYNKVEAASQISSTMRFSDMLETVETIGQLSGSIDRMMSGLGISGYYCCFNESDIDYIMSDKADTKTSSDPPYEDVMRVIAGRTQGGTVFAGDTDFPAEDIVPVKPGAGDMLIIYPVHYKNRDFGYMVIQNDYTPINVYNYRICHDSLGSNIANLHRQMILRSNVKALEELHMRDQMTNLHNRHGLVKFAPQFAADNLYSVGLIDMDGLKLINDTYGHLAGNNAICNLANAITEAAGKEDFVARYGGDEFLILSKESEGSYWIGLENAINERLKAAVCKQKLPYALGMSLGFAISTPQNPLTLDAAIEEADREMYVEKNRKKGKTENKTE